MAKFQLFLFLHFQISKEYFTSAKNIPKCLVLETTKWYSQLYTTKTSFFKTNYSKMWKNLMKESLHNSTSKICLNVINKLWLTLYQSFLSFNHLRLLVFKPPRLHICCEGLTSHHFCLALKTYTATLLESHKPCDRNLMRKAISKFIR